MEWMKVIQKACLNFDISINALHEINFFYTGNTQQQTEIIFTEDDSSCDSQKWGNLAQKKNCWSALLTPQKYTQIGERCSFLCFIFLFLILSRFFFRILLKLFKITKNSYSYNFNLCVLTNILRENVGKYFKRIKLIYEKLKSSFNRL